MAKTIKGITVEIGGNTTKLSQAIESAEKNLKSMKTELGQVDKALKLDPKNVELLSQKQQLLTQAIGETAAKLRTLESAQAEVQRQYAQGKIDGGAYREFMRELESTRASLKKLKEQQSETSKSFSSLTEIKDKLSQIKDKLQPVIKGFKDVGSAAGTAAAEVGKVAFEVGKIEAKALSVAGEAFDKYVKAAAAAATAIGGLTVSAGSFADEMNTMAITTGISTDELQKMSYAAELIDVDVDTITSSMSKMIKNMDKARDGSKSATAAFEDLGVSFTDQQGQLRNSQDVFADAIKALGEIENETERDSAAMAIFGKSAQELNPLIQGGTEALRELGAEADKAGLILDQEALDHLNAFNDSLDILKSNASATGRVMALDFSDGLKDITDIVGNGLPDLGKSFSKMFVSGDNSNFTFALSKMTKSLVDKVSQNVPSLLKGFNGLVLGVVDSLSASLPTAVNTILPSMLTGFKDLISGLIAEVPNVMPLLVDGGVTLFMGLMDSLNLVVNQLTPMLPDIVDTISTALTDNVPAVIEGGLTLLEGVITGIADNVDELVGTVTELVPVVIDTLTDHLPEIIGGGMKITLAVVEGIADNFPEIVSAVANLAGGLLYELLSYLPDVVSAGIDIVASLGKGIGKLFTPVGTAIADLWTYIKNTFAGWWKDLENIGGNIIDGIVEGFKAGCEKAWDAIADFGDSWMTGIKDIFGIHSPSRVMRDMVGVQLAAGIGVGFEDEMKDVSAAMNRAIPRSFDTNISFGSRTENTSGRSSPAPQSPAATVTLRLTDQAGRVIAEGVAPALDIINGETLLLEGSGFA